MRLDSDDLKMRAITAGLPLATIAESLGITLAALSNKFAGRRSFTEDELRKVRRMIAIYEQTAATQTASKIRVRKNRFNIPPATRHRALFSPSVRRAFSFQAKLPPEDWAEKHLHLDGGEK